MNFCIYDGDHSYFTGIVFEFKPQGIILGAIDSEHIDLNYTTLFTDWGIPVPSTIEEVYVTVCRMQGPGPYNSLTVIRNVRLGPNATDTDTSTSKTPVWNITKIPNSIHRLVGASLDCDLARIKAGGLYPKAS